MRPVTSIDPRVQADLEALGADIRRIRTALRVTQRDLEALAWLDQSSISRIERGLMPRLPMYKFARLRAAVEGRLGEVRRRPRRPRRQARRDDWDWP